MLLEGCKAAAVIGGVAKALRSTSYRDVAPIVMPTMRVELIEVFVEGARGGCGLPFPKWRSARSLTRLFTTSELQTSSHLTAKTVHNASLHNLFYTYTFALRYRYAVPFISYYLLLRRRALLLTVWLSAAEPLSEILSR